MTDNPKYLIITKAHAELIAKAWFRGECSLTVDEDREYARFALRCQDDTGADIEEIVSMLRQFEPCGAAVIEGQPCGPSLAGQKLGRRLRRLLERARGERPPGPGREPETSPD